MKHLTYVVTMFTLSPVQLLVTCDLRPCSHAQVWSPLDPPLTYLPNMIDALVELTGHHAHVLVGQG